MELIGMRWKRMGKSEIKLPSFLFGILIRERNRTLLILFRNYIVNEWNGHLYCLKIIIVNSLLSPPFQLNFEEKKKGLSGKRRWNSSIEFLFILVLLVSATNKLVE